MQKNTTFFVITALATVLANISPAYSTVITVTDSGDYETKEGKDFRQQDPAAEQEPDIDSATTNVALITENAIEQPDASVETVFATVLPAPENITTGETGENPAIVFASITKAEIQQVEEELYVSTGLYADIIASEAKKYNNIDIALIESVIEAESNYDVLALSDKGAMGLMQLMPQTAKNHNVENVFDPKQNIQGGTAELAALMDSYDNPALALAAYNAGRGAVEEYDGIPPYKETREYVLKVLTKTYAKRSSAKHGSETEENLAAKSPEDDSINRPMTVLTYE